MKEERKGERFSDEETGLEHNAKSMTIAKTCVGVKFKCSGCGERKRTDKQSTDELTEMKSMKKGIAAVVLSMGNPPELKSLKAARTDADTVFKHFTAPFGDDGMRILAREKIHDFESEMAIRETRFNEAKKEYIKAFNRVKAEFDSNKGDSTVEFPTEQEFAESVQWSLEVDLLPHVESSLYMQMDETLQKRMIKNTLKKQADATRSTLVHVIERLAEAAQDFHDKMKNYRKEDGKVKGKFKSATFENLNKQCDIAQSLNIDKDPKLTSAIDRIRKQLADVDQAALREYPEFGNDQPLRKEKIEQSREILEGLDDMRGGL